MLSPRPEAKGFRSPGKPPSLQSTQILDLRLTKGDAKTASLHK